MTNAICGEVLTGRVSEILGFVYFLPFLQRIKMDHFTGGHSWAPICIGVTVARVPLNQWFFAFATDSSEGEDTAARPSYRRKPVPSCHGYGTELNVLADFTKVGSDNRTVNSK